MVTYKGQDVEVVEDLTPQTVPSYKVKDKQGKVLIVPKAEAKKEHESKLSSHVKTTSQPDVTKEEMDRKKAKPAAKKAPAVEDKKHWYSL